jgi:hypothetical protein
VLTNISCAIENQDIYSGDCIADLKFYFCIHNFTIVLTIEYLQQVSVLIPDSAKSSPTTLAHFLFLFHSYLYHTAY